MRISDWSSDVCSSDLRSCADCGRSLSKRGPGHRLRPDGARGITGISGAGRPEFPQPARQGCLLSRQQKVSGATRGGSERIFYGGENIGGCPRRSEEHTSELQSLMRISYAAFCLTKKNLQHE